MTHTLTVQSLLIFQKNSVFLQILTRACLKMRTLHFEATSFGSKDSTHIHSHIVWGSKERTTYIHCIYPKIVRYFTILVLKLKQVHLSPADTSKNCSCEANSVEPDQKTIAICKMIRVHCLQVKFCRCCSLAQMLMTESNMYLRDLFCTTVTSKICWNKIFSFRGW